MRIVTKYGAIHELKSFLPILKDIDKINSLYPIGTKIHRNILTVSVRKLSSRISFGNERKKSRN